MLYNLYCDLYYAMLSLCEILPSSPTAQNAVACGNVPVLLYIFIVDVNEVIRNNVLLFIEFNRLVRES